MTNFPTISEMMYLLFTVFPCKFNSSQLKWSFISNIINLYTSSLTSSQTTQNEDLMKLVNEKEKKEKKNFQIE